MLLFVACILGQFVPIESKEPTVEEFEAVCKSLKADAFKASLKKVEESKKILKDPKVPKELKTQIKETAAKLEDILRTENADESRYPLPKLDTQKLKVGQIGVIRDIVDGKEVGTTVEVVRTLNQRTLMCRSGKVLFVHMKYDGDPMVDGAEMELKDIYRVTGHYKIGSGTYIVIEPWEKALDFFDHMKKKAELPKGDDQKKKSTKKPAAKS